LPKVLVKTDEVSGLLK